jgi:hypothetical protein
MTHPSELTKKNMKNNIDSADECTTGAARICI